MAEIEDCDKVRERERTGGGTRGAAVRWSGPGPGGIQCRRSAIVSGPEEKLRAFVLWSAARRPCRAQANNRTACAAPNRTASAHPGGAAACSEQSGVVEGNLPAASGSAQVICAKKGPVPVEVEAGKSYYWCTCGRSKNQV